MEIHDLIAEALKDLGHTEILKSGKIRVTTGIGSARFKITDMKFTCCSATTDAGNTLEIDLHEPDSIRKVAIMVLKCLHRRHAWDIYYLPCSSCPFNLESKNGPVIASPERHLRNNPNKL